MRQLRGHVQGTLAPDPHHRQQPLGPGLGHGALDPFGVGPHQPAGAKFRAAEPADAHRQHLHQVFPFQHPQHGRPGGAGRLAVVVRPEG